MINDYVKTVAFIPTNLLNKAGYSFHGDDTGCWFCWGATGTDIETGPTVKSFDEAAESALIHWLANSHPMHTEFVKGLAASAPEQPPPAYGHGDGIGMQSPEEHEAEVEAWNLANDAREVLAKHKVEV